MNQDRYDRELEEGSVEDALINSLTRRSGGVGLTRREALKALGGGVLGILVVACRGNTDENASQPTKSATTDFSARFAHFEPAYEPNGDLSKVVWPDFVREAGSEVQQLYEFQIQNGNLTRYMPCFCGCGSHGHRSNRDCYVKQVNPDGTVVFDAMAPT